MNLGRCVVNPAVIGVGVALSPMVRSQVGRFLPSYYGSLAGTAAVGAAACHFSGGVVGRVGKGIVASVAAALLTPMLLQFGLLNMGPETASGR